MSLAAIGYLCALVLAGVFVVAAATKLAAPGPTARSFGELGLPLPGPAARAVPVVELVVALALVLVPPVGAVAALVTLAFFTTFLFGRWRAGVTAPCACFGSASARPLSPRALVRNLGLLGLGVAALAAPHPTRPTAGDIVVTAVGVTAGWLAVRRVP